MPERSASIVARNDQPLIGVPLREGDQDLVRYCTDEADADAAADWKALTKALAAIGAWSDLDWTDMERELDHIGHSVQPTLPITDL